jgi:hypothetical protein
MLLSKGFSRNLGFVCERWPTPLPFRPCLNSEFCDASHNPPSLQPIPAILREMKWPCVCSPVAACTAVTQVWGQNAARGVRYGTRKAARSSCARENGVKLRRIADPKKIERSAHPMLQPAISNLAFRGCGMRTSQVGIGSRNYELPRVGTKCYVVAIGM